RLYWLLRVILSLFIGVVIVAVQFTGDWETGWVRANTSYKSFSNAVVNADVGLHVGLGGINVTLVGNPVNQINETISYNEHFAWRFGENYDQAYRDSLEKGLPSPILYVAEKFTQQSPCSVHNQYRISGHYASATMWVAFCAWLISNMLFSMPVLVYGGYMSLVTGIFMIFSLLSFSTIGNSPLCTIQFGPVSLHTVYGASFWLTLATSLLCFLIGGVVVVLHYLRPRVLRAFFDLSEDEEEGDMMLGWVPRSVLLLAPAPFLESGSARKGRDVPSWGAASPTNGFNPAVIGSPRADGRGAKPATSQGRGVCLAQGGSDWRLSEPGPALKRAASGSPAEAWLPGPRWSEGRW
uniref:Dual oxidase maturation factor 2 n=1 Tax=Pelodiscus sinensis TaxID=13735 RepID=K7GFM4_PELSI